MANPDFGYCVCPVCHYDKAAVRIAANNKAYISCEECVSNVRTLSSVGDRAIRALLTSRADGSTDIPLKDTSPRAAPRPAAQSTAASAAAAPPAAEVPKKSRGAFGDALDVLAGGR